MLAFHKMVSIATKIFVKVWNNFHKHASLFQADANWRGERLLVVAIKIQKFLWSWTTLLIRFAYNPTFFSFLSHFSLCLVPSIFPDWHFTKYHSPISINIDTNCLPKWHLIQPSFSLYWCNLLFPSELLPNSTLPFQLKFSQRGTLT